VIIPMILDRFCHRWKLGESMINQIRSMFEIRNKKLICATWYLSDGDSAFAGTGENYVKRPKCAVACNVKHTRSKPAELIRDREWYSRARDLANAHGYFGDVFSANANANSTLNTRSRIAICGHYIRYRCHEIPFSERSATKPHKICAWPI